MVRETGVWYLAYITAGHCCHSSERVKSEGTKEVPSAGKAGAKTPQKAKEVIPVGTALGSHC